MKIISCHIENFGNISNKDIDFTSKDGITEIIENNGWGKSTLAAFIRAMFYGLSTSRAKNLEENERERFLPWNTGVCGGSLVFEANEKQYIINRTFSKKASNDTFSIYDANTNLPVTDFGNELGEKLFNIDKASFQKTVYIGHATVGNISTSDSINAKLGGISDIENDLGNAENAIKKCTDYINSHSKTKKNGLISVLKTNIDIAKKKCEGIPDIEKTIQNLKLERENILSEKETLTKKQKNLTEKLKTVSEEKEILAQVETYLGLAKKNNDTIKKLDEASAFFSDEIPTYDDCNKFSSQNDKLREMLSLKKKRDSENFLNEEISDKNHTEKTTLIEKEISTINENISKAETDLANATKKYINTSNETDEIREKLNEVKRSKNDYEKNLEEINSNLKEFKNQAERAKETYERSKVRKNTLLEKKDATEKNITEKPDDIKNNQKKKFLTTLSIISAILLLTGILFFILIPKLPLIPFILAGIGLIGLIYSILNLKNTPASGNMSHNIVTDYDELEKEIITATNDEEACKVDYEALLKKCSEYEAKLNKIPEISEINNSIEVLMSKLTQAEEECNELKGIKEQCNENLVKLKADLAATQAQKKMLVEQQGERKQIAHNKEQERIQEIEYLSQIIHKYKDELLDEINRYLSEKIYLSSSDDLVLVFDSKIIEIRGKIQEYETLKKNCEETKKDLNDYEKKHPIAVKSAIDLNNNNKQETEITAIHTENVSDINNELDKINISFNTYNDQLEDVRNHLENALRTREELSEYEDKLKEMNEQYEDELKKLEIVISTKDLLESSRNQFISRHMSGVQQGFDKYYELLSGEKQTNIKLNAKMELVLTVNSDVKKIGALSSGYMDLCGLCYRMAIIDEMYKKEKPFIILDDSLLTLDDDKLARSIDFLKKIAQEYQVIYFTCSKSRHI